MFLVVECLVMHAWQTSLKMCLLLSPPECRTNADRQPTHLQSAPSVELLYLL